ncbi:unnamed protein product [Dibothriocephalus latus]|uniref:Uncharacterized protein n=1 Tax=Dibothriocephalus latus TaxID=60516 RepID=A0A3P6TLS1_DIBLA|nr:unnamed protein product [Dibothriocephalus latus]
MNRVLEEPNEPAPDNTLDYGYEGGISDGEEDPHEEGEKDDDESSPSNLASLASGSQLYENVGENTRSRNSRAHGTLYRAFNVLDDLPNQDSNLHLVMPTTFPRPPPPPQ